MEVNSHEVLVELLGTHPASDQEVIIAQMASDKYTIENVASLVGCVLGNAVATLADGLRTLSPRLKVRVRSDEGLRPCLNLSAARIGQIAYASASLDFDHCSVATIIEEDEAQEAYRGESVARPELVVVFVGDSPTSGKEVVLSRLSRQWYTLDDLQATVAEAIAGATQQVGGDIALWDPQVGVRLSSERGIHAALYLPAELIQAIASCGASLDFDPYV
ncbi:hypothetical protein [Stenotrophomonas bentonitica]|uniref:hypothetical protein n=1 Tax=Stenotrophomonas bentonitica TaxID=1450134 RepID=UPI00345F042F